MAELQLRVMGDLEVIRGDAVLELPPSRKTRGLLAYLALREGGVCAREQLVGLLWGEDAQRAARAEGRKITAFRVFAATIDLNRAVEVGLVMTT